jgi:Tol biopolymer transport system component
VAHAGDYLLFVRNRALVAQKLDRRTWTLTGEVLPIAPAVAIDSLFSRAMFDASADTLVLQKSGGQSAVHLKVVDGKGTTKGDIPITGAAMSATWSPDGGSMVMSILDTTSGRQSVWLHDRQRGTATRLTFGQRDVSPVWSPDGKWIAYGTADDGGLTREIVRIPSRGGGAEETLVQVPAGIVPLSWSPDGRHLAVMRPGKNFNEVWALSVEDKSLRLLARANGASISRDGRWLAYTSDEGAGTEVFLTRFPAGGGKWQVTNGGGQFPGWSRDGKKLYYVSRGETLMAMPVTLGENAPELLPPAEMFSVSTGSPSIPYDEAPDGSFVVSQPVFSDSEEPLHVIVNWQEKLRKR